MKKSRRLVWSKQESASNEVGVPERRFGVLRIEELVIPCLLVLEEGRIPKSYIHISLSLNSLRIKSNAYMK